MAGLQVTEYDGGGIVVWPRRLSPQLRNAGRCGPEKMCDFRTVTVPATAVTPTVVTCK